MAAKNTAAQNLQYSADPTNMFKGGDSFNNSVGGALDPFNLTGWNNKDFHLSQQPQSYPTYIGMDPNSTQIAGGFSGPNSSMDQFTQNAQKTGPTQGTELALQANTQAANQGRDQANKIAAGQAANAESALAMKGGTGAGTSAMLAKNAGNQAAAGANQADAAAGTNRTNMLIQDSNAKNSNLSTAAQMQNQTQNQNYNMAAGDVNRLQTNQGLQNAYNMNMYNQNMGAWAAGNQANATAASGKK